MSRGRGRVTRQTLAHQPRLAPPHSHSHSPSPPNHLSRYPGQMTKIGGISFGSSSLPPETGGNDWEGGSSRGVRGVYVLEVDVFAGDFLAGFRVLDAESPRRSRRYSPV